MSLMKIENRNKRLLRKHMLEQKYKRLGIHNSIIFPSRMEDKKDIEYFEEL